MNEIEKAIHDFRTTLNSMGIPYHNIKINCESSTDDFGKLGVLAPHVITYLNYKIEFPKKISEVEAN